MYGVTLDFWLQVPQQSDKSPSAGTVSTNVVQNKIQLN